MIECVDVPVQLRMVLLMLEIRYEIVCFLCCNGAVHFSCVSNCILIYMLLQELVLHDREVLHCVDVSVQLRVIEGVARASVA